MSIKTDLKKERIEVIYQLDSTLTEKISKSIAHKLTQTFTDFYLNEDEIFTKFLKLNMYKARMPEGMAEANYFYKNTSIYFNEHIDDEDLEEFAIHECLHYFQEKKEGNKLLRMGLTGTGLNEAAVQYIASKIIGIIPDTEMYYGITLNTPSPSYYPLECALLNQLLYFTDENLLFKSTLFSTDDFENELKQNISEKIYNEIKLAFDNLLKYEERLVKINNKISILPDGDSNFAKLSEKSSKYKDKITNTFVNTQNLIFKSFFDNEFNNISNLEDTDNFRRKLDKFKPLVGTTNNYSFFEDYYLEMMNKLEHKCNVLENGGETAISTNNKITSLIKKFKHLLFKKETDKI